jgi:hypothetical protein
MAFIALVIRRTIATTVYACRINSRNMSRASRLRHFFVIRLRFLLSTRTLVDCQQGFLSSDRSGEHVLWPSPIVSKGDNVSLNLSNPFVCLLGVVWALKIDHCQKLLSCKSKQIIASAQSRHEKMACVGLTFKEPPHNIKNH